MRRRGRPPTPRSALTRREGEILEYAACELTNSQIAEALGMSAKTVANTLQQVYRKLGVSSRAGAIAISEASRREGDFAPRDAHLALGDAENTDVALSGREKNILEHVARDLTNKQIAEALGISATMVARTLGQIYPKLGVSTRQGAIVVAIRKRLIEPASPL